MNKSQITKMPEYFDRYIHQVPDIDIIDALHQFGSPFLLSEKENLLAIGNKVYDVDKWTVVDIIQHIIDTERIFTYRALRFARKDQTPLPGFDENTFAAQAHANDRSLEDLLEEFDMVRHSTIALFKSFNEDDMQQSGFNFRSNISVLAIGFTLVGHVIHHMNIMKERYYPIINA